MNNGVLYTALSGILYGSIGYFGSSLMAQGFSISGLLLWRFLLSALILLPIAIPAFRSHRDFKVLAQLFFLGAIFYGVNTALYFEASKTIGTGLAMVIFFAYPIFVVLLSTFVSKTPIGSITLTSLICIVVGCILIAYGERISVDFRGISFAVLSGLAYGTYIFFSKQVSGKASPILASFTVCLGSSIGFVVYCLATDGSLPLPTTTSSWLNLSLFSFFGTVLPVLFMLLGLKSISANKASIISVLEPVTTLVVGALILGEAITGLQFVGAFIILASAILVQLEKEEAVSVF